MTPPADGPPDGQEREANQDAGAQPGPPTSASNSGDVVQEQLTPVEKLADPAAAGELPADAATPIEKTAEAAAPAPEGAQPKDAATKAETAAKPTPKPAAERPARPAKEAEPKGPARNPPPPGSINEVLAAASGITPAAAYMVPEIKGESVAVEVARDDIPAVMTACRDDNRLDLKYLRCLSGVDWQEEGLEVVYHLYSFTKNHALAVKTRVSYDDASVPSIAGIYPAANWHERETRDMFGVDFTGHPDLRPLLLPEDMTDHFPLRKENPLQEIEEWQGENLREGAGDEGDE
jgi:NADH-quinone oxidoreductase subunit C